MQTVVEPSTSPNVGETVRVPRDLRGSSLWSRLRACGERGVLHSMVPVRACFGPRTAGTFGILMYHRTAPAVQGVEAPTWNVTPHRFRQQMEGLLARGYEPWPLRMALEFQQYGLRVPPKTFVVTFDDGYECNYVHAWPILKELGIPATIFVATAYLDYDRPFPNDDWGAAGAANVPAEAWRPLTTGQCAEMFADGLIDLGTHTHTHDDFRGRPESLRNDLVTSLAFLHERFGLKDATFAFPYGTRRSGFCSPELVQAARDAGVLCSLNTESELASPEQDPFTWGRFTAEDADNASTLAAKLDGWYSLVRDVWRSIAQRGGEVRR
jgi:peptidoglycan/xylan/chitin deacetylase (PgdA/CDA1 family)